MKKVIISIVSFLFIFFISGCSQVAQLNDRLIVQGIGIDYEENEYEVTLQVLNVKSKDDKSSDTPKEVELIKNSGRTVMEAISNIKEKSGKEPLFSQTLVVIMGSDAAKKGLNNFMDFFTRHYEFSPLVEVLISQEKAADILSLEKNEDVITAENILAISNLSSNKNRGLNSNIGNLVSDFKNEYLQAKALYINIVEKADRKELSIEKLAIFKEDKLFYVLDDEMTKGFLLIKSRTRGISDVVYNEDLSPITYSIVQSDNKIKMTQKGDILEIYLPINVEVKILETDKNISSDNYDDIKSLIKSKFENMVINVIEKTIIEDEIDIFGFSSLYLRRNLTFKNKSVNEVKKALKNAHFNIDIKVSIESEK